VAEQQGRPAASERGESDRAGDSVDGEAPSTLEVP